MDAKHSVKLTMSQEKFHFTPEDEQDREELRRVLAIMERRNVAGETQPQDYREAVEKRDKEDSTLEKREAGEPRNIEDIADTVIFDWDGVLLDSMERISRGAAALITHLGEENIPKVTGEEVEKSYDAPFWEYYKRFGIPVETPEDRQVVFDYFHQKVLPELSKELPEEDVLFPEVRETLAALKQKGLSKNPNFRIGIVSAGQPERIQRELAKYELDSIVDFVIGSQHSKTEALKEVCEQNKLNPERTLYFGDLPSDIRDVRGTGLPIKIVSVARLEGAEDRLGSYDPDYLVRSVGDEVFQLTPFEDKEKRK
jgi:phosphoglycolate phosphatase-like HAD superfamily hydrolase